MHPARSDERHCHRATSHRRSGAGNALDGNPATLWHSQYSPERLPLPQSITLDLGGVYDVSELAYLPRTDGSLNGTITAYNVYASSDGQSFTRVAAGAWQDSSDLKFSKFSAAEARYIRAGGYGEPRRKDLASAAEIYLFGHPSSP